MPCDDDRRIKHLLLSHSFMRQIKYSRRALAKAFARLDAVADERLFLSPLKISLATLNKGLDAFFDILALHKRL